MRVQPAEARTRGGSAGGAQAAGARAVRSEKKLALGAGGNGQASADDALRTVGAVTMFARTVHGIKPQDFRGLVDDGKRQIKSGVVAIVGVTDEGKAGIVVGVTDD